MFALVVVMESGGVSGPVSPCDTSQGVITVLMETDMGL